MIEINRIYNENCLIGMYEIPDGSVDMILCDLPYGTTACKWDAIIPFDQLWTHYRRIIKGNGAIVLTASQPFTSALVMSNESMFRYEMIWEKDNCTNFMQAKRMPLKYHESILIFSAKKLPKYNPIFWDAGKVSNKNGSAKKIKNGGVFNELLEHSDYQRKTNDRYPKSIQKFNTPKANDTDNKCIHPTQKPVDLFTYLIKTFSNEGDLILDNCIGSGTTAIACIKENRNFIGFETDNNYYNDAYNRIESFKKTIQFIN